ncbi:MAG: type II toxin-antitoxin system RelE/ParE family toxin [Limnohabitans sp.]
MDTIKSFELEQTPVFVRWLKDLKDVQAKAAIVLRLKQVQAGHLGDAKSVGAGVSELRWHLGPGYRVYFCRRGQQIIVLLAGGDKSTQVRDIARAKQLAKEYGHGQDDRV